MRASAHRNSSADGHRFCDGGTIVLKRCVAAALIGGVLLADWNQAAIVAQFAFAPADRGGALPGPMPLLPPDNWWNQDISQAPVDPRSPQFIAFINNGGTRRLHPDFGAYEYPGSVGIYGFPYVVVPGDQPRRAVLFDYADESDGVDRSTGSSYPFYPIPDDAITQPYWIEGGYPGQQCVGGDRHMLLVDRGNKLLYELFA